MIEHPGFYHLVAGEGHRVDLMGQSEVFLQSDSSCCVFFNEFEPGNGVPMHIHHAMDEACYVISGQLKFEAEGLSAVAGPGDWVSCKRGIAHGFVGVGSDRIRLLWVCTPGGYDEFFDEASKVPIGADGPDMTLMMEIAARHQTELVGPPPSQE